MALILENGSGVSGANAYVDSDYVTAYLTDRNRQTENGWTSSGGTAEDAACIAGTDYIEIANRELFKGAKEFSNISTARATLALTGQPLDTETVTVGTIVYRYVNTLAAQDDVQIGSSTSESLTNLVLAIKADPDSAGTAYEATTVANTDATAVVFIDDAIVAFAIASGTPGNDVVVSTTVTAGSWNFTTLVGGSDIVRPQPLSFPRAGLFDSDGVPIIGIPDRLKFAAAEYAVRARRGTPALAADPVADPRGGSVTAFQEIVGPIEESTEYLAGTANTGDLTPYPAADRLLDEYLKSGGGVMRG